MNLKGKTRELSKVIKIELPEYDEIIYPLKRS